MCVKTGLSLIMFCCLLESGLAGDGITLDNVVAPASNKSDEPFAKSFSSKLAADFLDSASLQWQKQRKCMTCHTNYAYLYARPALGSDAKAHKTVRRFAEQSLSC